VRVSGSVATAGPDRARAGGPSRALRPGELVHVDIKKLGRIRGVGHSAARGAVRQDRFSVHRHADLVEAIALLFEEEWQKAMTLDLSWVRGGAYDNRVVRIRLAQAAR
jgi:hypothetical protein